MRLQRSHMCTQQSNPCWVSYPNLGWLMVMAKDSTNVLSFC